MERNTEKIFYELERFLVGGNIDNQLIDELSNYVDNPKEILDALKSIISSTEAVCRYETDCWLGEHSDYVNMNILVKNQVKSIVELLVLLKNLNNKS